MTELQSDEKHNPVINKTNTKSFASYWVGIFFMISSVSLIIVLLMFVFIWQPIWTEGFKDFHTISTAINKLDITAQPASETVPLMLAEMNKMNENMFEMNKTLLEMHEMSKTMHEMQITMRDMDESIGHIETMTPNIEKMTYSVEQMTMVISTEMPRLTYLMGRVGNKIPNMDFMPFN